jgi:hypothetical protein
MIPGAFLPARREWPCRCAAKKAKEVSAQTLIGRERRLPFGN